MNTLPWSVGGFTKKYNIPRDHLEYKYIEQCTDEVELNQIYEELV